MREWYRLHRKKEIYMCFELKLLLQLDLATFYHYYYFILLKDKGTEESIMGFFT